MINKRKVLLGLGLFVVSFATYHLYGVLTPIQKDRVLSLIGNINRAGGDVAKVKAIPNEQGLKMLGSSPELIAAINNVLTTVTPATINADADAVAKVNALAGSNYAFSTSAKALKAAMAAAGVDPKATKKVALIGDKTKANTIRGEWELVLAKHGDLASKVLPVGKKLTAKTKDLLKETHPSEYTDLKAQTDLTNAQLKAKTVAELKAILNNITNYKNALIAANKDNWTLATSLYVEDKAKTHGPHTYNERTKLIGDAGTPDTILGEWKKALDQKTALENKISAIPGLKKLKNAFENHVDQLLAANPGGRFTTEKAKVDDPNLKDKKKANLTIIRNDIKAYANALRDANNDFNDNLEDAVKPHGPHTYNERTKLIGDAGTLDTILGEWKRALDQKTALENKINGIPPLKKLKNLFENDVNTLLAANPGGRFTTEKAKAEDPNLKDKKKANLTIIRNEIKAYANALTNANNNFDANLEDAGAAKHVTAHDQAALNTINIPSSTIKLFKTDILNKDIENLNLISVFNKKACIDFVDANKGTKKIVEYRRELGLQLKNSINANPNISDPLKKKIISLLGEKNPVIPYK